MVKVGEDGVLVDDVIDLLETDDLSFLQYFQCYVVVCVFLLREFHSTKGSYVQT